MKKLLIISTIIITIIILIKETNKILIPEDSIRVRIIANSNKIEDQIKKLKVKEKVNIILNDKLKNIENIDMARKKINESIPELENVISKTINNNDFNINYGNNYFPKKELNGINYKEGNYESLVINLGESKGNNWWCVLFPPICMLEATYNETDNVEYKSKVIEIINHYK